MSDFVAYHSVHKMGYAFKPAKNGCGFYSRKARSFLESVIGSDTWVVMGTRDARQHTNYQLVAVYTPSEVRDEPDSFLVWGSQVC